MAMWQAPAAADGPLQLLQDISIPVDDGFEACADCDDTSALAGLLVETLQSEDWEKAAASGNIEVKDVSGFGGNKTYRVTGKCCCPPRVALHIRRVQTLPDPCGEERTQVAAMTLAAAHLAPQILGAGDRWFIESWEGDSLGTPRQINDAANLQMVAELLAAIHRIPIDWYDNCRRNLCKELPMLTDAPRESHIWWFANRMHYFQGLSEASIRRWISAGSAIELKSKASERVVTCHGDFHPGNIVKESDSIKVIDLECACVTLAVQDLAWACEMWLKRHCDRYCFARAYLEASGYPSAELDVLNLLADAEQYGNYLVFGPVFREVQDTLKPVCIGSDSGWDMGPEEADFRVTGRRERFAQKKSHEGRNRETGRQRREHKSRR